MKQLLSPKQVAQAIQVSESSVKRWCDAGDIKTEYTAGGHRRIRASSVIEFVRTHPKVGISDATLLGLPAFTGIRDAEAGRAALQQSLLLGDRERGRAVILDLFMAQIDIVEICDDVIAPVFYEIGRLWECGSAEIYQERRACEHCRAMLQDLYAFTPIAPENAPIAVGGCPAGDQYGVATTMVELMLRFRGWRAVSLGSNLPLETVATAVVRENAELTWLSISHLDDEQQFLTEYQRFVETLAGRELVIGGAALHEQLRAGMGSEGYFCESLRQLDEYLRRRKTTSSVGAFS